MKWFYLLNDLLRNRKKFVNDSLENGLSRSNIVMLVLLTIIFFALFGIVVGINHSVYQALATAIKLPFLFLITTLICFPTLYFFLTVLEARQEVQNLLVFILICLSIMSVSLITFAPISVFFLLTTDSYQFYKLVNVLIFSVSGFVGLYFFYKNLNEKLGQIQNEISKKRARIFLKVWLVLFAFIGSQLSYSLSPFFGDPSVKEFILFTNTQKSFFVDIIETIMKL